MRYLAIATLLLIAACGPLPKDYDAMAKCGAMGYKTGTVEYDACVKDETQANSLKRFEQENERRQEQDRQDRALRPFR